MSGRIMKVDIDVVLLDGLDDTKVVVDEEPVVEVVWAGTRLKGSLQSNFNRGGSSAVDCTIAAGRGARSAGTKFSFTVDQVAFFVLCEPCLCLDLADAKTVFIVVVVKEFSELFFREKILVTGALGP